MLEMKAQSIGEYIYHHLTSFDEVRAIQSIFKHSCNIGSQSDARLITITQPLVGNLPYGIMLSPTYVTDFRTLPWQVGDQVIVNRTNGIKVPLRELSISFSGASIWESEISQTVANTPRSTLQLNKNMDWSAHYLLTKPEKPGMASLLPSLIPVHGSGTEHVPNSINTRPGFDLLQHLISALKERDSQRIGEQVGRLIGLGIGLTPSADDVLTGLLASFFSTDETEGNVSLAKLLRDAIQSRLTPEKTTRVSYTQLWYASNGMFSEKVIALLETLHSDHNPVELTHRVDWMLSHGATSGAEMTMGVLIGLEITKPFMAAFDKTGCCS